MKKLIILILLIIVLAPVVVLGMTGLVPGLSSLLGTDKPRDLGIMYSPADLQSCRSKSQLQYETLDTIDPAGSRQFSGARQVTAEFSSAEITATLNNQPWTYWPYRNIQVKFNADGSGEVSGTLLKDRVPGYAAAIGIPSQAVDFVMKFFPANPVFYVKGKAALAENQVAVFEPQAFAIGRISLPVDRFLALRGPDLIAPAYALDIGGMIGELGKVQDKKGLIVGYINGRLSSAFGSFYAKSAYFADDKLVFDGTLTEEIGYTP